jgi:hypothetical protein
MGWSFVSETARPSGAASLALSMKLWRWSPRRSAAIASASPRRSSRQVHGSPSPDVRAMRRCSRFVLPVLFLAQSDTHIVKSTLLLQMAASLSAAGHPCLFASGEESHRQVSARAHRLGIDGSILLFVSGRELPGVVDAARSARPFLPRGRFDPGAPRSVGGPGAGGTLAGSRVRGRAGGVRQGRGASRSW